EPWVAELQRLLPALTAEIWSPGAAGAEFAIVWRPSQQFFDEQGEHLSTVFNAGAGVGALLQVRMPPRLPAVRRADAGMGVQMAEYACHAVIQHYREFAEYEASQRHGEWTARPLRPRREFPVGVLGLGVLGERVARAIRVFDFPTLGWSRSDRQVEGVTTF